MCLLHPHNPLIFVANANFLLCMHTPASLSPSLSILSLHRANSSFHFRSFTHGVCRPPSSFFTAHIDRYASLARCA